MERKPRQPAPPHWLKLPGESAKAYEAFARFRDLREARSFTSVGRMLNCSKQNIWRWATRWKWNERCVAYDRHWDAIHLQELIAERREMKRRQGRFAVDMQGICLSQIEELLRRAEEGQPLNLTVPQMARFIELGAKLERDARGEDSPGGRFTNINVITEGADEAEVTNENQ